MSLCPSCDQEAGDVAKFCPSCGSSIVRAPAGDDFTGRIFANKFRVEELIGEGGMGKVFKATQLSLDKKVVLKVLRQSLLSDARTVARFQREAKAASRLNHPNSISVIDFGQSEDGAMYIAMELVTGKDLHQVLSAEGPLSEPRMVRIVGQVLSALSDAHAAGVIHRDLKPENIMVEQRRGEPDFVKVLDFGIAKIQESDGQEGQALTRAGFVGGTPEYMSPEQARGATLDARSDLYAVGVILYQCATNLLPFESESAVGLATMHLTTPPVPPRQRRADASISDEMEDLILRAMAKDPADRPQSAEDFRSELLALQQGAPALSGNTLPASPSVARRTAHPPHREEEEQTALARTPSWASVPEVEENTQTGSAENPDVTRRGRSSSHTTALVFAGALIGTTAIAGLGVLVYDNFIKKPKVVTVATIPEPSRPGEADPKRAGPGRARELNQAGTEAVGSGRYEEALGYFTRAWEADPTPSTAKRLALCYLAKSDNANAAKWMRQYLTGSVSPPDSPYVERFLNPPRVP